MKIGELLVELGFKTDDKGLKKVDSGMKQAKLGAIALTAAVAATAIGFQKLIKSGLESAVVLKNFQVQTGLSRDELQKWSFVADQNDISGQELIGTIKGIQQAQASLRMGGGNIKPFQLLGISPTEDPFTILDQLKGKIKDLDPAIATSILSQLGVGENFLNVLKNGNLEFSKLNKQFLLSQKEQDTLIVLNKSFKELAFALRAIKDRFAAMISPPIAKFLEAISNNFKFFLDLGKKLPWLVTAFKILTVAVAALGVVLAAVLYPIPTIIGAIIVAVIAVIDDLYTFIKGGDSVFGLFVDGAIKQFNKLKEMLGSVFQFFKDGYDKYIAPILEKLEGAFSKGFVGKILGKIAGVGGADVGKQVIQNEQKQVPAGFSSSVQNNNNNSNKTNTNNNTNNIKIEVSGASDSKKVAFDIKTALSKELNKAYYTSPNLGV